MRFVEFLNVLNVFKCFEMSCDPVKNNTGGIYCAVNSVEHDPDRPLSSLCVLRRDPNREKQAIPGQKRPAQRAAGLSAQGVAG